MPRVGGAGGLAERAVAQTRIQTIEVRMVEDIERLEPQLDLKPFCGCKRLIERPVPHLQRGPDDVPVGAVAVEAIEWCDKR